MGLPQGIAQLIDLSLTKGVASPKIARRQPTHRFHKLLLGWLLAITTPLAFSQTPGALLVEPTLEAVAPIASPAPTSAANESLAAISTPLETLPSLSLLKLRDSLVQTALTQIGQPYRWGSADPSSGFDCSGLVRYVFQTSAGLDLPHNAAAMMRHGQAVNLRQLQTGDLVFFNTRSKKNIDHVGIYVGQGQFIHAPNSRQLIRQDSLQQGYWQRQWRGARRNLLVTP